MQGLKPSSLRSPGVGEERLFWLYLALFATRGHGNGTDPEGYLDRSGGGGGMVKKESAVVFKLFWLFESHLLEYNTLDLKTLAPG